MFSTNKKTCPLKEKIKNSIKFKATVFSALNEYIHHIQHDNQLQDLSSEFYHTVGWGASWHMQKNLNKNAFIHYK